MKLRYIVCPLPACPFVGGVVALDRPTMPDDLDHAHDWLIQFVAAHDASAVKHYFHMCDGQHETCGCPWEGNDDPR